MALGSLGGRVDRRELGDAPLQVAARAGLERIAEAWHGIDLWPGQERLQYLPATYPEGLSGHVRVLAADRLLEVRENVVLGA
jgi:hypothetical protein